MQISDKSTVYISFIPNNLPKKFELIRSENGKESLEFERFLNGRTPRIKFNVPIGGNFLTNVPVKIEKIVPIELPEIDIELPPFERDRVKDFIITNNPDLDGTPARVHTEKGIIELGTKIKHYPAAMKVFFIWHELGHFYYKTEKFCDLFALVFFLKSGWNMSTAMYCLTNILNRTPQNMERILFIYKHLIKKNASV